MTTAPTPSDAERLAGELDYRASIPLSKAAASMLRRLQAENEHLLAQVHKLEMDALDLASENSILKRAEEAELEARKPLPPDALADKCEAWLQAGGAANIVEAFEAGYRAAEET